MNAPKAYTNKELAYWFYNKGTQTYFNYFANEDLAANWIQFQPETYQIEIAGYSQPNIG
jgi:hypothetical protein